MYIVAEVRNKISSNKLVPQREPHYSLMPMMCCRKLLIEEQNLELVSFKDRGCKHALSVSMEKGKGDGLDFKDSLFKSYFLMENMNSVINEMLTIKWKITSYQSNLRYFVLLLADILHSYVVEKL